MGVAEEDRKLYTVKGMSCEHCVASVREELSEVEGVGEVSVDLESGEVAVSGDAVSDEAVRIAVETAGYELAGRV